MFRTVSDLSPVELEFYRNALRKRKHVKCQAPERLLRARKVARSGAKLLKEEFGAKKVVLFGSTLRPPLFHVHSDVDLAVWGLDEKKYFRALSALLAIDPEIGVDLIEFDFATPRMQKTILNEGKIL